MTVQPEALRIADFLEKRKVNFDETQNAANELRRLYASNAKFFSIMTDFKQAADSLDSSFDADAWMIRVNEAIEKFQP